MEVFSPPLSFYVDALAEGRCFSFIRLGNGEWGCILGILQCTPSGSQALNISSLRQGLVESVRRHQKDESYFLAMQSRTYLEHVQLLRPIEQWLRKNAPSVRWHCGEVFHKASLKGRLYPLIAQLRKMQVIVVGPSYLRKLRKSTFGYEDFVEVRVKDCYQGHKKILGNILRARGKLGGPVVVSFSAGPTAKVLIHKLHDVISSSSSSDTFLIDFGSMWDPYVGRRTRRYHARVKGEILKRNLGI